MNFRVESFCDEEINANTYLIFDDQNCIIIDPANNIKTLNKFIDNRKVLGIFLTHCHYDHFKMLNDLLYQYDTNVYIHQNGLKKLSDAYTSCAYLFNVKIMDNVNLNKIKFVIDGQNINLKEFKIKCLYLPGHSNCSMGYLIGNWLFVGDVLFASSVGRYDLPTGNYVSLIKSLEQIKLLNHNLVVYPGHDFSFILKDAIKNNPYLK